VVHEKENAEAAKKHAVARRPHHRHAEAQMPHPVDAHGGVRHGAGRVGRDKTQWRENKDAEQLTAAKRVSREPEHKTCD